jgi:hypothetical protein
MSQLQVTGEAKIRDIQGPVVANSGVVTALDGDASQYVRGDGTLADFPTSSGGGSSVSYYLNSSVSQGTIGGVAYRQLGKTPISGAGTDIAISSNGYVASYITDANDPALLEVPAGNFNCEFYFSVNNNTGNPFVYAEIYKYDGTTFTLLGTSVGVPEYINQGTVINPYYFAVPVAVSALSVTDRISIRIYVNVDGRTVTLHTENNHLCQVVTTFSKGLISLNNLTRQNQFFATGTSGTDFGISSSVATHTFNLPVASATNTGKLSSTDWSTFNNKQNTITDPITGTGVSTGVAYFNSGTSITSEAAFNYDASTNRLGVNTSVPNATIGANAATDSGYSLLLKNDNANYNGIGFATDSTYGNLIATEKLGTALARNLTLLNQSGYISLTEAGNLGVGILTPNTGLDIYNGTSAYLWLHTANSGITGTDGVRLALFNTNGANLRNYEGAFSITAEGDFSIITIGAENFRVNSADGSIYQSKVANAMLKSVSGVITAAVAGTDYVLPSALTGYVPTSRTLTINGTAYDLSADRSWSVGTMGGSGVSGRVAYYDGTNSITSEAGFIYDSSTNRLGVNTTVPNATIGADSALDSGYGLLIKTGSSNYNGIGIAIDSTYGNLISTEKLGTASARNLTLLNQSGFVSLKENGSFGVNTLNPAVSGVGIDIYSSTSAGLRFHTATSGTTVSDGAGINFSAANNLGITNYEAGAIDIVTNGNSGVYIASNGYVGINGATPSVALTVNGSGLMNGNLVITKSSGLATINFPVQSGGNDVGYIQHDESTVDLGIMRFSVGDNDLANDYFVFGNTQTGTFLERFKILATGVVTIGTWNGSAIADAYISSASTWNAKQNQLNGTGFVKASGTTITYDNSTYLTTSAAASTYLALTGGTLTGALGGTSASFSSTLTAGDTTIINVAPILAIQSNTTGNIFLRFRQSADTMASMFYTNATATFTMSNNMGGLRFNTSGVTDALNILSNGIIQLATISTITSDNNTFFSYSPNGIMYLQGGSTGLGLAASGNRNNAIYLNSTTNVIQFHTNDGNEKMRLTSNGVLDFSGNSTITNVNDKFNIGVNSTSYVWMQSWSGRPISINPSGNNVLIGTTTDNGNKLQVTGTAKFTGQIQSDLNNFRSSSGTQAGNSTGDIFRFLSPTGAINNGCYSAIFYIWVSDNNTGANAYSATIAVQTTSNGQLDASFNTLVSRARGINPVISINLVSDGGGGAAKITMTTSAIATSGVTYQCSAIGIF